MHPCGLQMFRCRARVQVVLANCTLCTKHWTASAEQQVMQPGAACCAGAGARKWGPVRGPEPPMAAAAPAAPADGHSSIQPPGKASSRLNTMCLLLPSRTHVLVALTLATARPYAPRVYNQLSSRTANWLPGLNLDVLVAEAHSSTTPASARVSAASAEATAAQLEKERRAAALFGGAAAGRAAAGAAGRRGAARPSPSSAGRQAPSTPRRSCMTFKLLRSVVVSCRCGQPLHLRAS